MMEFYGGTGSIFVDAYDAFYRADAPQIAGDVAFYERIALETGGPVLELACGTGRIAIPLAQAGLDVTGVDASAAMLAILRGKLAGHASAAKRLTLVCADMSAFDVSRQFGFAFIAFRSFQHLLSVELQRKTLAAVHRHLAPNGRLALHLFDPRLDVLRDGAARDGHAGTHPVTGRRYAAEIIDSSFDHVVQVATYLWRYAELGPDDTVLAQDTRAMRLRWTYRWELRHLLELSGFAIEAEYSDFAGAPPVYGKEMIVVARKRTATLRKRSRTSNVA